MPPIVVHSKSKVKFCFGFSGVRTHTLMATAAGEVPGRTEELREFQISSNRRAGPEVNPAPFVNSKPYQLSFKPNCIARAPPEPSCGLEL
jgi:hypothetical protein